MAATPEKVVDGLDAIPSDDERVGQLGVGEGAASVQPDHF
jgi:hypothetical protein